MCMCLPIGLCIDYAYFFDSFMHQLFPRIVMCTHYFLSIYARILVCMHARISVFIFTCLCIDYLFSFFSLGVVGGGCFLSSLWGVGFQPPPGFGPHLRWTLPGGRSQTSRGHAGLKVVEGCLR